MTRPDEQLDRLLAECLVRIEQEGSSALDAACMEHPELATGLRRRVSLLAAANLLELAPGLDRLPERLGDFEPRERLGEGAMGVVHRARQVSTGRDVALKLVRPEQLVFSAARVRFRREVELSARLHHPAILPVLAVGETEGLPWFALELVHGASLSALLDGVRARFADVQSVDPASLPELLHEVTPPPLQGGARAPAPRTWRGWALRVALAVARGVAHAHEKGVLHRDVKPSNVLLGADGRVYLTDFGLAGEPGEGSLTATRAAVGSLPYMAPEVLDGERPDARSDVYGIGALTYELLTLHRPFEAATSAALVRAILEAEPRPPRRHAPSLGADEEAVVLRALAREPRQRYATAWELAEDLENLLAHRTTHARPAGLWLRSRRFVQRRPAASAALLLGLLLVVGTPSAVAWSQVLARRRVEEVNAELDRALDRERAERARADQNLQRAEDANAELDLSLGREREERARADLNLDRATHAVDELLSKVGTYVLDEVPLMQQLKRDLLERALAVLAELEPQTPNEPGRILQAISVDLAAGIARWELREVGPAREHLERGLARLEGCTECSALDPARALSLRVRLRHQLASLEGESGDPARAEALSHEIIELVEGSEDAELQQQRVFAFVDLFELAYYAGRKDEARQWMEKARAELALYGDGWPRLQLLNHRAAIFGKSGTKAYMDNDDETAVADLRTALDSLAELRAAEPESVRPRIEAVAYGINLAAAEMRQREFEDAGATLAAARSEVEELVRLFPSAPEFRVKLAGLLINLGLLKSRLDDPAGAREAWEAAAAAGRLLAADPEPTGEALLQAGLSLSNLSSLDQDDGRFEDGIAHTREAEEILRRAVALTPGHVVAARSLEFALLTRANCELALGHPEEMRRLLDLAEEACPEERYAKRGLTEGWLKLAAALPEEERPVCYARALSTLQRAVALGWNDPDDLVRNEFLDPLRAMPGFPTAE